MIGLVKPIPELKSGEKILDLACGTGIVSRAAAEQLGASGHITGLDPNAGMLRVAQRIGVKGSCTIEWVEGSACEMPLEDGTFEVTVYSSSGCSASDSQFVDT